jgi:hypothetical protein
MCSLGGCEWPYLHSTHYSRLPYWNRGPFTSSSAMLEISTATTCYQQILVVEISTDATYYQQTLVVEISTDATCYQQTEVVATHVQQVLERQHGHREADDGRCWAHSSAALCLAVLSSKDSNSFMKCNGCCEM